MMKKLEERCAKTRPNLTKTIVINSEDPEVGSRSVQTIEVPRFPGLEKAKSVPMSVKKARSELEKMDPSDKCEAIKNLAVKHLKEQRAKGNIENGVKGSNFEKHELQEVNALLYGFTYNHNSDRMSM